MNLIHYGYESASFQVYYMTWYEQFHDNTKATVVTRDGQTNEWIGQCHLKAISFTESPLGISLSLYKFYQQLENYFYNDN